MKSPTAFTHYNIKIKKFKRPRLMLVGSFDDLFLEAITELGYDFCLNKSSKPTDELEFDLVVIDADRSDQALDYVKKYKAVPVMMAEKKDRGVTFFNDFDALAESGNAFLYEVDSTWFMLEALLRATETFKFQYDWKNVLAEVKEIAKYAKKNVY